MSPIDNNTNLDCITEDQLPVSVGVDPFDFQKLLIQVNRYCLAAGQDCNALRSRTGEKQYMLLSGHCKRTLGLVEEHHPK